MDFNSLKFNKTDDFIDGQIVEKFYIDNHEVTESTYYNLLEERMDHLNQYEPVNQVEEVDECDMGYDEKQKNYLETLLNTLDENPDDRMDILYNELGFYHRLGVLQGQMELHDIYCKAMRQNYRTTQIATDKFLEDCKRDYDP
jgi:hypothetical protein